MNIRNNGQSLKSKAKMIFTQFLNRTPSNQTKITKQPDQIITIFTADGQLYRAALEVMWVDPNRFQNFIPRICGMHWIMSFV